MSEYCVELGLTVRYGVTPEMAQLHPYVAVDHRHLCASELQPARQAITVDMIHATAIILSDAIERLQAAPTLAQAHDQVDQFLRRLRAATE